jgi:predicted transcriptional regulator
MRKMDQDEQVLRATKEIVVKFIETGRVSPTGFPEVFKAIYRAVDETVKQSATPEKTSENAGEVS